MYLSVMLAAVTVFPFRTLGFYADTEKSEVFEIDRITVRKGFGYAVRECEGYAFDIATGGGTVALDIGADHFHGEVSGTDNRGVHFTCCFPV